MGVCGGKGVGGRAGSGGGGSKERSSQDLLLFYVMKQNLEIMASLLNRFKNSGSEVRRADVGLPSLSVQAPVNLGK